MATSPAVGAVALSRWRLSPLNARARARHPPSWRRLTVRSTCSAACICPAIAREKASLLGVVEKWENCKQIFLPLHQAPEQIPIQDPVSSLIISFPSLCPPSSLSCFLCPFSRSDIFWYKNSRKLANGYHLQPFSHLAQSVLISHPFTRSV